jgi:putative addiction module killer protein
MFQQRHGMSLLDMSTTMSMETMCPRLGDVKSMGEGVSEIRIDVGADYRAYFTMRGNAIVILLCGGEKKTQRRDIQHAAQLAKEV